MNEPERMSKAEIAVRLRQAGAMLRFRGESVHRARAYEVGADAIEAFAGDLGRLIDEERLTDLPGIGRSLATTVSELFRERRAAALDRIILMGNLPPSLLELVNVPGFTARRIRLLHEELGVETVDDVRAALAAGAVAAIKGIGGQAAQRLRAALERVTTTPERLLLGEARLWGERLAAHLRDGRAGLEVTIAGSIRRCAETIGDVNLVAAFDRPDGLVDAFVGHPAVATITARGDDGAAVRLGNGVVATLTVAARAAFGAALVRATGSASHLAGLADRARDRGLDLARLRAGDEEAVYRALGLPWIPPELREGRGEIEAAAAGDDFADLVTLADLQGVVHCHSVYSDGRDTIGDMAEAAARRGLSYLTVTDHSPAASYAGGLSSERLRAQAQEIAAVQPGVAVRLLRGAECDILQDGSLDHEEALRTDLDVVIASIHERHRMDGAAMTTRLERALATPRFKIWGHPLGRLLLRRPPIACDIDRVLDVIAGSPAAIEVNGSPARLDLPWELIPGARARGIKFVISADAHSVAELDNLRTGVDVARRGGLRRGDVLNTLPADDFARAVAGGRSAA